MRDLIEHLLCEQGIQFVASRDLDVCLELLGALRNATPGLFVVTGPHGSGKTRLVEALWRAATGVNAYPLMPGGRVAGVMEANGLQKAFTDNVSEVEGVPGRLVVAAKRTTMGLPCGARVIRLRRGEG